MHFLEISYCSCEGRLSGFSPSPVVRNTNSIRTFWRFCIAPAKARMSDLADFPESVRVSLRVKRSTAKLKVSIFPFGIWGWGWVHIRTRVVVRRTPMPLSAGNSQSFKVLLEPKEDFCKRKIVETKSWNKANGKYVFEFWGPNKNPGHWWSLRFCYGF